MQAIASAPCPSKIVMVKVPAFGSTLMLSSVLHGSTPLVHVAVTTIVDPSTRAAKLSIATGWISSCPGFATTNPPFGAPEPGSCATPPGGEVTVPSGGVDTP